MRSSLTLIVPPVYTYNMTATAPVSGKGYDRQHTSEDRGQQHCRRQLSAARREKTKTNPKTNPTNTGKSTEEVEEFERGGERGLEGVGSPPVRGGVLKK